MGMIADEMSCPGRGGNQGSRLPEMSANGEKGRFGQVALKSTQDSSGMPREGAVEG